MSIRAGITEKIPYLKELGVNCVELMPIHEFDEFENHRPSPVDGHMLYNLWGYSNVDFFASKAAYASTGKFSTDFSWHGVKAWQPWTGYNNLTLAFMLNGHYADDDGTPDDFKSKKVKKTNN